ncbi:DUF962-domain-containing protein [Trametopsis cervina]|nr:DUF962-domain-containing protein [Trametopsis cervina]
MAASSLFDIRKQLAFYGAYHNNPVNIFLHLIGVPLLLWSAQILFHDAQVFLPTYSYVINDYLRFDLNFPAVWLGICVAYYAVLDPTAALLYLPQSTLSLLTATAYAYHHSAFQMAAAINVGAWIAQFIGHGVAEKRAPALLDNILGAFVLAPFFVHLEILFALGYKPRLRRDVKNTVGVEIARFRRLDAEKKAAKVQ